MRHGRPRAGSLCDHRRGVMDPSSKCFDLTPSAPLVPANAVVVILWTHDGRYLLQHRDRIPTIFYPDHWGFFGGATEPDEQPFDTLRRELREELALDVAALEVKQFSCFQFDVPGAGWPPFFRVFYEARIDPCMVPGLRLGEGAALDLVDGKQALHALRLVPYDGFALWIHVHRRLLARKS